MATYRITKNRMEFDSMLIQQTTYVRYDTEQRAEIVEYTVDDEYTERFEANLNAQTDVIKSWERINTPAADQPSMYERGIRFAVTNIKRGDLAGSSAGYVFNQITQGMNMPARDAARSEFNRGVRLVELMPMSVEQAIREKNFALIDGCWARGEIPQDVFPLLRDLGVMTGVIADAQGRSVPGVRRTLLGE